MNQQTHAVMQEKNTPHRDVVNQEVQVRRGNTKIPLGKGGSLHDYVPFYFAPRSPMLYYLQKQQLKQEDMVYFMSAVETVQQKGLNFVFTDAHAIRRLTKFYTDTVHLAQIDWKVMESDFWNDINEDMNRKARRQAEVLMIGTWSSYNSDAIQKPRL